MPEPCLAGMTPQVFRSCLLPFLGGEARPLLRVSPELHRLAREYLLSVPRGVQLALGFLEKRHLRRHCYYTLDGVRKQVTNIEREAAASSAATETLKILAGRQDDFSAWDADSLLKVFASLLFAEENGELLEGKDAYEALAWYACNDPHRPQFLLRLGYSRNEALESVNLAHPDPKLARWPVACEAAELCNSFVRFEGSKQPKVRKAFPEPLPADVRGAFERYRSDFRKMSNALCRAFEQAPGDENLLELVLVLKLVQSCELHAWGYAHGEVPLDPRPGQEKSSSSLAKGLTFVKNWLAPVDPDRLPEGIRAWVRRAGISRPFDIRAVLCDRQVLLDGYCPLRSENLLKLLRVPTCPICRAE